MTSPDATRDRVGAVLFDAAGTLIALRATAGETYTRLARGYGVDLPASRVDEAFRRVLARAEPMVFPGAARTEIAALEKAWWRRIVRATFRAADGTARFSDFDAYYDALFEALGRPEAWQLRPGALDTLLALGDRGLACAIVSNFDHRLPGLLEGLGLADRLDAVVLASDAGCAKPAPAIFALALARLGVPAERAVVVGDDPRRDLRGAREAGLRAIDVRTLATLGDLLDHLDAHGFG